MYPRGHELGSLETARRRDQTLTASGEALEPAFEPSNGEKLFISREGRDGDVSSLREQDAVGAFRRD